MAIRVFLRNNPAIATISLYRREVGSCERAGDIPRGNSATPDLGLIKQAEQGCMRFGRASPATSSVRLTTAVNAGDSLLI
jgi:hypothetical protein